MLKINNIDNMVRIELSSIKGTEISDIFTWIQIKICLNKIDDVYIFLMQNEAKGVTFEKHGVIEALESLKNVFEPKDYKEALLMLAQNNHPNRREILFTGGLYARFKGDKKMATQYYTELVKYYKEKGNEEEALRYDEILKNL